MSNKKEYIFMWSLSPTVPCSWGSPDVLVGRNDVIPDADLFYYYDGDMMTAYMAVEELEEYRSKFSPLYLNPDYLHAYRERFAKEKVNWWNWVSSIEIKNYSSVTRAELCEDHKIFTNFMRDALAYFFSTRDEFTYTAQERLQQILQKHFSNNWLEMFSLLTSLTDMDDMKKEYFAWLKLTETQPNEPALLNHASRFPWLVFGQFDEYKVTEFLRERIIQTRDKSYLKELNSFHRQNKALKQRQHMITLGLGSDAPEAKYLSDLLQTQTYERMEIKSYWAGCYYLSRNMWKAIGQVLGISIADLLTYVFPPEIQAMLKGNLESDLNSLLAQRRLAYAFDHVKGEGIKILSGQEAKNAFLSRIRPKRNPIKFIQGQPASLGKYVGRVRKVIAGNLDDLQKSTSSFNSGEILVTSMTQPNMLLLAQKAGAIVTDEGGITSHAAIISRELNIPCIVGCLSAMQVLSDGDLVEVDANTGIVQILEETK